MINKDFESLAKHLLTELPGCVVKSPMVFVAPAKHVLRGLYFEGSDFDKESFYVWAFFLPLYVPTSHVSLTFGKRVGDLNERNRWNASAPNLISELGAAVKQEALPFISGLESPRDIAKVAAALGNLQNPHVQEAIAYSLALAGDIDQAVAALDQLVKLLDPKIPWQRNMVERSQALRAKVAVSAFVAQQQLAAWESESVRNLGLEYFTSERAI